MAHAHHHDHSGSHEPTTYASDTNGMNMDDSDPGDMIYDMQMTFNFKVSQGVPVLFENFKLDNGGYFFAALLLILGLAICTEGLSFIIWKMKLSQSKNSAGSKVP